MEKLIMTSLTEDGLKVLIKEALKEVMESGTITGIFKTSGPELMDIKEAADFLRLKITTLYEKTSRRLIPHFKKGNKLYFERTKLEEWLKAGEVRLGEDIEDQANEYLLRRKKKH